MLKEVCTFAAEIVIIYVEVNYEDQSTDIKPMSSITIYKAKARRFFLLLFSMLMVTSGMGQSKGMFNGLRQAENCATPEDSAMLIQQNALYVGLRGEGESMLYNKWWENPLTYTPMMEAAWRYCQRVVPGEKRLYVDAANMYRYIISKCTTGKDSAYYFNKLMQIYDLRLENLEIINAHARNVDQLTSKGALEMRKIQEYRIYMNDSLHVNDSAYYESVYRQYLPVMNGIIETIKQGEALGSDIQVGDFQDFFLYSLQHYIYQNVCVNAADDEQKKEDSALVESKEKERAYRARYAFFKKEQDRINKEARRGKMSQQEYNAQIKPVVDSVTMFDAKVREEMKFQSEKKEKVTLQSNQRIAALRAVLMSHYDAIYNMSELQKKVLSQGFYGDSTLTEEQQEHKVDSICKVYDDLVAFCQDRIQTHGGISLGESTIADLDMKYGDSLAVNKNNGAWLEMVWKKCNNTTDFDPFDPFCESVYNALLAYNEFVEEAKQAKREKERQLSLSASAVGSQYTAKGWAAWKKGSALLNKGNEESGVKYLYLALYYYNKAVKEDASQRVNRDLLKKQVPEFDHMVGLKGKVISVDGVSFTAGN